jgi:hypothetical protein
LFGGSRRVEQVAEGLHFFFLLKSRENRED